MKVQRGDNMKVVTEEAGIEESNSFESLRIAQLLMSVSNEKKWDVDCYISSKMKKFEAVVLYT